MSQPPARDREREPSGAVVELTIDSLAAGGDGVGRDANGRVTFIPRTAPGDVVRAQIGKSTSSFARASLVEIVTPSPDRVDPPCPHFLAGCGGCQWQHVARSAQLAAKHAIVVAALRKLVGVVVHPIADPGPPLHWRRRARFHVTAGTTGLYELESHHVIAIETCPQLEEALDAALAQVASASPPDGELGLVIGHRGDVAVAIDRPWRGAAALVGKAGIRGVIAGHDVHGEPVIEIERGLWGSPRTFAQASAPGNAALIARVREVVGKGSGKLLELYAGSGNFTRGFAEDGWKILATDAFAPELPLTVEHRAGPVDRVIAELHGPFDVVVLDPPRSGAAEAIDGIVRMRPRTIAYVSCDPATLARDAARLQTLGYRATEAWPFDLMPQTSHVEVVMALVRG
ncbi:MAG: class I SAM-dependent RNA methyltransferase [Deltaproteobacteria bacterium]|nr:class I SAM-dependent RNA methyltransferase [Deltaproteobacteria bacterium]